jgi:hypothetical protein
MGLGELTAEIILPRSWLSVAVVEEGVGVERPQRSEDERPGGSTSDGENGSQRKAGPVSVHCGPPRDL